MKNNAQVGAQQDKNRVARLMEPMRDQWGGIVLAILTLFAYGGLVVVHILYGTLTHGAVARAIGWIGCAFVLYLGAILWSETRMKVDMRLIWTAAIAFRLLLVLTTPTLSGDVYRYLWDGHVANNGVSPYAFPIDAPQMDALDVPIRALANHAWMASPYLPAAQWLFTGVTGVAPLQPLSMQIAMVIIDLLNGVLIFALLTAAQLPGRRVLIYLWNPLAVVESAHSAHVDVWMVMLTLLAVWLAWGRSGLEIQKSTTSIKFDFFARDWLAPIALGLATLTKILPVLLLPVFFWEWRWRRLLIYAATVAIPIVWAGTRAGWGLTGPLDGEGLFAALRIYGYQWNFNSGLFHWLEGGLAQSHLLNLDPFEATQVAKAIVALLMVAVLGIVWLRAHKTQQIRGQLRLLSVPLMAYILLTPTMHPWYLLLLLAFVPFLVPAATEWQGGWFVALPWLYLSGALYLSYLTYADPLDLREYEWVRWVEWGPTLALLLIGVVGGLIQRQRALRDQIGRYDERDNRS